ncbi:MAG: flagellar assembly protein FliW [Defluviitaleaceae bacterium]|nr:flagellar assembly protein FliW [Defluviitaleaceae bacterium]
MKLETRNFGEIEILEQDVIDFNDGLPGFPESRRFVLLSEDDSPVSFLQSVEGDDVSFVVVDMMAFGHHYHPWVDASHIEDLGEYDPAKFVMYNIATIFENLSDSTVNLKAPIVINAADKKGKQVICENEEYTVKDKLFGGGGADADAGSQNGEGCE